MEKCHFLADYSAQASSARKVRRFTEVCKLYKILEFCKWNFTLKSMRAFILKNYVLMKTTKHW